MCQSLEEENRAHHQRNVEVVNILVEKQCDLCKPLVIENVFYASDNYIVKKLKQAITQSEFNKIEFKTKETTDSAYDLRLIVKISIPVTIESLNKMTDVFVKAAYSAGCEYDGWYTKV